MADPPYHLFAVFSELESVNETGELIPSFAQCPNCGAVHRVTEVGTSVISSKDSKLSLSTKEDIEMELPDKMITLLKRHECDLHVWQEARFVINNKKWGHALILIKEREGSIVTGKYATILDRNFYKLETFEREDGLI